MPCLHRRLLLDQREGGILPVLLALLQVTAQASEEGMTPEKFLDAVIAEVQRQGLNSVEIATKGDLQANSVRKVLQRRCRRPAWDTVMGIALAVGMRIEFKPACDHNIRDLLNERGDTRCRSCGLFEKGNRRHVSGLPVVVA
jgi:DNA-binding phage protein